MKQSLIQQLKIQACKWSCENASANEYENLADKKFAELIVRECMEIVGDGTVDGEIYHDRIKNHFGVYK